MKISNSIFLTFEEFALFIYFPYYAHTHNFGLAASETAMYRVIQLKYSTGYNLDSL